MTNEDRAMLKRASELFSAAEEDVERNHRIADARLKTLERINAWKLKHQHELSKEALHDLENILSPMDAGQIMAVDLGASAHQRFIDTLNWACRRHDGELEGEMIVRSGPDRRETKIQRLPT